jgi:hypothetical protein
MNETLIDILLIALPTTILLISWLILRIKNNQKRIFVLILLANIIVLATIGILTHKNGVNDNSRLASAILHPSTILLNGPLLISSLKENVNIFWLFLFSVILAPFSYVITMIILLFTGQIYI